MSYNSGVIGRVISNHWPDYSLNCTPLSPITITNELSRLRRLRMSFDFDYLAANGSTCRATKPKNKLQEKLFGLTAS